MDTTAIINAGFSPDDALREQLQAAALACGVDQAGPYEVLAAFCKGAVSIAIERNTSTLPGGFSVTYPAVCVITGPNGRAACNPEDSAIIMTLAEDLK